MKKKWLAGILTVCMLLSILPTNAFAAGEGADAETGEQENAAIEGTLDTVGGTDSNEALEGKATGVAQIGTTTYLTLAEAVEKAGDGDTVAIIAAGTYTLPSIANKKLTIKANDGVKVTIDMSNAVTMSGSNLSFEGLTIEYAENSFYKGFHHIASESYRDCTIKGQSFLYGEEASFVQCVFETTDKNNYNVWTYGAAKVKFDRCTFNSAGKSVLVYNEGGESGCATELTVVNCHFYATQPVTGKAAIEIDTSLMPDGTKVVIDSLTTAEGFDKGSISGNTLWNDKKDRTNLTVVVGDKTVWPSYAAQIGEEHYLTLDAALTAAKNNDTITLLENVAYAENGKGLFNITKSITLDGAGHTISGYGTRGSNSTSIAINNDGTESISVTLKNLNIKNNAPLGRAVETRGKIVSLTLENCNFECTGAENTQVLTIGGSQADAAKLVIKNSTLTAGNAGYPVVVFNPIDATITDGSTLSGYCGINFKGESGSSGSRGSVVNAENSHFDCPNVHDTEGSNAFGVFVLVDDNITINLTDCSVNAKQEGTAEQAVLLASSYAERRDQGYKMEIKGAESYINGTLLSTSWAEAANQQFTVTGGTYTVDPTEFLPTGYAAFPTADGKFVVGKAVTSITLSDAALSLALNESHTLTAKVEPDDAYNKTVTWSTDNADIAAVDEHGVVTAKAIGKATITATIGDKSASCEVTVSYAPVANVTLDNDKLSMVEGGTTTITATVTPNNADQTVVWTSDKESVAKVEGGIITAVAPGTATITATVGGKSASCVVTVVAKPDEDETAVVPSVEEPAVKVDAELPQAVEQAVTEAAQSVDAGQALTGAAQQEAAALDRNEAKQEQLLDKAKDEGITGSEDKPVVLYTQTYLEIQVTEAKAEGSEVTSVTMDITPKMQIVASTAASSADIDLEGADKNAVVVESGDLALTRAEITVQLPDNFAQKLVFIRHEAEKGVFHYQDQADAQGVVTFTTRHGFSPFTFSLTDGAAAWWKEPWTGSTRLSGSAAWTGTRAPT